MKYTPAETTFLRLLENAGGEYCPGTSAPLTPAARKLIRVLNRKGAIRIEETQDGERYTLVDACHG